MKNKIVWMILSFLSPLLICWIGVKNLDMPFLASANSKVALTDDFKKELQTLPQNVKDYIQLMHKDSSVMSDAFFKTFNVFMFCGFVIALFNLIMVFLIFKKHKKI